MAPIERKPLPPPNSRVTTIREADRAEIIAHATDVMDYYLNGAGSYFDGGTQKPLVSEFGNSTVDDLKNFMGNIIASKQFADDPNSIMDSIVELIEKTINQVEQAARDNEGRDSISRHPPDTNDPIDDPRVISPRVLGNGSLPISLFVEGREPASALEARGIPGISSSKPVRILSRRGPDEPLAFALDTSALAASDRLNPFADRFGNWTASPAGVTPRNPNLPLPAAEPGRPPGIFSGKPMPLWTTSPPILGSPDSSEAPGIGTKPIRYVSRREGNTPPASVFDTGAPAAQFVLPDQLNTAGDRTDWAAVLAGRGPINPMQAAPQPQAGGTPGISSTKLVPILSRRIADQPQASAFDTGVPAVPLAPSDDRNFSRGLAGRIAVLTGFDPDNPDRSVPPPGGLLKLLLAAQR